MRYRQVMIKILLGAFMLVWNTADASPAKGRKGDDGKNVLYIQRQEGDVNVRADLDNFLILLLPTTSSSSSLPSFDEQGLMNYLLKVSYQQKMNTLVDKLKKKHQDSATQETQHFIESKTAPYHVDISESNESKVTPTSESSLIALSPSVSLKKTEIPLVNKKTGRFAKAMVFTIPEDEFVLTKTEDKKKVVKKDGNKKKNSADFLKRNFVLFGVGDEECAPGTVRDSYGNCIEFKKNI